MAFGCQKVGLYHYFALNGHYVKFLMNGPSLQFRVTGRNSVSMNVNYSGLGIWPCNLSEFSGYRRGIVNLAFVVFWSLSYLVRANPLEVVSNPAVKSMNALQMRVNSISSAVKIFLGDLEWILASASNWLSASVESAVDLNGKSNNQFVEQIMSLIWPWPVVDEDEGPGERRVGDDRTRQTQEIFTDRFYTGLIWLLSTLIHGCYHLQIDCKGETVRFNSHAVKVWATPLSTGPDPINKTPAYTLTLHWNWPIWEAKISFVNNLIFNSSVESNYTVEFCL